MERLHGESLQRRLDVLKSRKERLTIDQTIEVLIAIASALAAVHRAGITHRDLKPGNVVLAGDRVVLVDFGLFIPEFDMRKQTVAGSGEFIAPEVIKRKVVPGKGPLIDLYALGIMGYELLCGHTPFVAPTFDKMLRRHLEEAPVPVATLRPDVPPALAALIAELLRKEPTERPGSADEVVFRLTAMRSPNGALENVCPRRAMVLDRNPTVASSLRRALKLAMPQLAIETETDPKLGLQEIERTPPDVVIVNLDMPGLNGVEIAMAIAAMSPERRPRVIGMSARATAADISVMHRLGCEAFVQQNAGLTARLVSILGHLRRTG
jgi:serine/threonine protein kinase